MSTLITGRQPVFEALKARQSLEKILLLYGGHGGIIEKITRLAKQQGVPVVQIDKKRFSEIISDADAQGVAAIVAATAYVEIDALFAAASAKKEAPLILVLDEIEDPHNMGALIRTAECAGFHGVVLPKHHGVLVNETVVKASAGATLHLPAAKVTNIAATLEELKKAGVWIVGTAMDGEKAYDEMNYEGPTAIVIGNEGRGMRRLVKEKCDFLVRIPLFGKVESLNASVAGALVMFEAARTRRREQR